MSYQDYIIEASKILHDKQWSAVNIARTGQEKELIVMNAQENLMNGRFSLQLEEMARMLYRNARHSPEDTTDNQEVVR